MNEASVESMKYPDLIAWARSVDAGTDRAAFDATLDLLATRCKTYPRTIREMRAIPDQTDRSISPAHSRVRTNLRTSASDTKSITATREVPTQHAPGQVVRAPFESQVNLASLQKHSRFQSSIASMVGSESNGDAIARPLHAQFRRVSLAAPDGISTARISDSSTTPSTHSTSIMRRRSTNRPTPPPQSSPPALGVSRRVEVSFPDQYRLVPQNAMVLHGHLGQESDPAYVAFLQTVRQFVTADLFTSRQGVGDSQVKEAMIRLEFAKFEAKQHGIHSQLWNSKHHRVLAWDPQLVWDSLAIPGGQKLRSIHNGFSKVFPLQPHERTLTGARQRIATVHFMSRRQFWTKGICASLLQTVHFCRSLADYARHFGIVMDLHIVSLWSPPPKGSKSLGGLRTTQADIARALQGREFGPYLGVYFLAVGRAQRVNSFNNAPSSPFGNMRYARLRAASLHANGAYADGMW